MRVEVWVREQAGPGEELLGVRLVRDVARALLEDDVVEREAILERPHHCKLVD